jgi:hypothetical protein
MLAHVDIRDAEALADLTAGHRTSQYKLDHALVIRLLTCVVGYRARRSPETAHRGAEHGVTSCASETD